MLDGRGLQLALRGTLRRHRRAPSQRGRGQDRVALPLGALCGARAGGLDPVQCDALEAYGRKSLGVAFQVMDDVLDLSGDARTMGKVLFSDLREGKLTHPLLLAVERDPRFAATCGLARSPAGADTTTPPRPRAPRCATPAPSRTAVASPAPLRRGHRTPPRLPNGRARDSLASVAAAMLHRRK
jgi:octaprenyl-diphosphate synthase